MELTSKQLRAHPEDYTLIDIRSDTEVEYGMIPGAVRYRPAELLTALPADRSLRYVIYCQYGYLSAPAAQRLEEAGYDACSLAGGYAGWLVEETASQDRETVCKQAENSLHKQFRHDIWGKFTKALKTYDMIQEGDCIGVCISGGKDSMLMAKLFQELKRHSDFPFDVKYIVMDPGYNLANRRIIENNAALLNIPIQIFASDIFDSVYTIEDSPCYLCARMRRGHLYAYAKELGCNKIALGHHYDDVIETILMGMLYGAQIQSMMPKLHSTNFEGMELIRPLYLIREDDIKRWRDVNGLHFIQCACKFTENTVGCENNNESKSKRLETKRLIRRLKETNPDVENHIFRSAENVNLDTLIAYKQNGVRHHFLDDYDTRRK